MPRKGSAPKRCPRCGFFLSTVDAEGVKKEWKNAFKPWSREEMTSLVEKVSSGMYLEQDILKLADEFERPPTAISKRMAILGLRFPVKGKPEGLDAVSVDDLRRMEKDGEI